MCVPAAHVVVVSVSLEENPTNMGQKSSERHDHLSMSGCVLASQDRTHDFSVSSDMGDRGKTPNWLHYTLHEIDGQGRIYFIERAVLVSGVDSKVHGMNTAIFSINLVVFTLFLSIGETDDLGSINLCLGNKAT